MSGFDLPTKSQIRASCNAVESVLDALSSYTSATLRNRSRTHFLTKALCSSLQRLEEDEENTGGAFHTADGRAKHNLAGVLTGCCVVAGQLRLRIGSNALRHDDSLVIELTTLTSEIEEFLKLCKPIPSFTNPPRPRSASESSALVDDLLQMQQKHESKVEDLVMELRACRAQERAYQHQIEDLDAELAAKDQLMKGPQNHNDAQLFQIRRLHAAISNLGLRHPLAYKTYVWKDLANELPAMLQRVEDINVKLKELELERDQLRDQQHDSETDTEPDVIPSSSKKTSDAHASKLSSKSKEQDKDGRKKKNEHRKSSDWKTPPPAATTKARSPSPTSSEASRANTSKFMRRKR